MTGNEIFILTFAVLGGLALFIFGMNIMTDGLRQAAGPRLRSVLSGTTRNRWFGILLGTVLGTLVHSSATTVMLVGFVNAGLMTLVQSVPPILGANIGTTVSMQAISFKLGDYCFVAIAIGFIIMMGSPKQSVKHIGRAIMGFGILFLGMNTMSEAIKPHREALAPFLEGINSDSLGNILKGVGISAAFTAIWQSSGATIAICFAFATAGIFTDLGQVFPIVMGAHIGTCATALLGCIGTNINARRCAASHLIFNLLNVTMAIAARKYFFIIIPLTSSDLIRQTANLHSLVMIVAALLLLPVSGIFATLVRWIVYSRKPPPEPSHMDASLLDRPEQAIYASIRELKRVARLCTDSFREMDKIILYSGKRRTIQQVRRNEEVVNEIKSAMKTYLQKVADHHLSKRQSILLQHLDRCITDIERIGDHIDEVAKISRRRKKIPHAIINAQSLKQLFALYHAVDRVLELVVESLDPDRQDFQEVAGGILQARDDYARLSIATRASFTEQVVSRAITPIAGMYFSEYISALDRIVRHAKMIALVEQEPQFWVERKKLQRVVGRAEHPKPPDPVNADEFLDKIQPEEYE